MQERLPASGYRHSAKSNIDGKSKKNDSGIPLQRTRFAANSLIGCPSERKQQRQLYESKDLKLRIPWNRCTVPSAKGKICGFWAETAEIDPRKRAIRC